MMTPYGERNSVHMADVGGDALLRRALRLDAIGCLASGILLLIAGSVLDGVLGTPLSLLWPVGVLLITYAVVIGLAASRRKVRRSVAWAAVEFNLAWAVASVALVVAGWLPLTAVGTALILVQAVAVALIADLQFLGLRRVRATG